MTISINTNCKKDNQKLKFLCLKIVPILLIILFNKNISAQIDCNINAPLSLPWLAELIANGAGCSVGQIIQFEYNNNIMFSISPAFEGVPTCQPIVPLDTKFYYCDGSLFCSSFGNGAMECPEDTLTSMENRTTIWTYTCTEPIEYEITTPPICVGEDLFSAGISINGSGNYYNLGENYLGELVYTSYQPETFIVYRSSEAPYSINPVNITTGCSTEDISIEAPNCQNTKNSCDIVDPINSLPWLQNSIEEFSSYGCSLELYYQIYYHCIDGLGIFEFRPIGCCDFQGFLSDMAGNNLCVIGGIAGLSCPQYDAGNNFEDGELIWSCIDVCELPVEVGPCDAAFSRYYYSKDAQDCLEFTYGGCGGNANNYESYQVCIEACGSEDPCSEIGDPLQLPWLAGLIENAYGCELGSIEQFEYKYNTYFKINPYPAGAINCPTDIPTNYFNCEGEVVCTIGFGLFEPCDEGLLAAATNSTVIWNYNNCEDPLQLELVMSSIGAYCVAAIYAFEHQNVSYIYVDQLCEELDGADVLYNCTLNETCIIGGLIPSGEACYELYFEISGLLTEENIIWSAIPCSYEFSGTVNANTNCEFIIELDNGNSILPFESNFEFYDGQQVEFSYIDYQWNFTDCEATTLAKIICIRETERNSILFEEYSWLTQLINIQNCEAGVTITEYAYPGGVFNFLHITKLNGTGNLYFQDGTFYCSDTPDYSCTEAYSLMPTGNSWKCDRSMPPDEKELFNRYVWLSSLIDPNTCAPGNKVTEYDLGSYSFVFVENSNGGKLYFEDGTFYCADAPGYNCRALYGFDAPTASWTCGGDTGVCLIDDPLGLSWVQDIIATSTENYLDAISIFNYEGSDYIRVASGSILIDGTMVETYNCNGILLCRLNIWFENIYEEEYVDVCRASAIDGEIIWEANSSNELFQLYPWLNTLVDVNNCVGISVKVYSYGTYNFISVENNESKNLYFQDGTFYCSDAPNYNCLELYGLNEPESEWNCEGLVHKQATQNVQQKIAFDVDFKTYPNPSNGLFTVEFNHINNKASKLKISSIEGKLIEFVEIEPNQRQVNIDLTTMPKGMYVLQLQTQVNTKIKPQTQRIIIR